MALTISIRNTFCSAAYQAIVYDDTHSDWAEQILRKGAKILLLLTGNEYLQTVSKLLMIDLATFANSPESRRVFTQNCERVVDTLTENHFLGA